MILWDGSAACVKVLQPQQFAAIIRANMRLQSSVIVLLTILKMKFSVMGRYEY
jgi:hypothetical protein